MTTVFGDKLLGLRTAAGESLSEAGKAVGCTKQHFWALERGQSANPTLSLLRSIATHYKIGVAELIDDRPLDLS